MSETKMERYDDERLRQEGYIQTKYHRICKRCGLPNDNTAGCCVMCGREFERAEETGADRAAPQPQKGNHDVLPKMWT